MVRLPNRSSCGHLRLPVQRRVRIGHRSGPIRWAAGSHETRLGPKRPSGPPLLSSLFQRRPIQTAPHVLEPTERADDYKNPPPFDLRAADRSRALYRLFPLSHRSVLRIRVCRAAVRLPRDLQPTALPQLDHRRSLNGVALAGRFLGDTRCGPPRACPHERGQPPTRYLAQSVGLAWRGPTSRGGRTAGY